MIKTGKTPEKVKRLMHPLKLTALNYLREALIAENYSQCKEIIAIAKDFGATDADIQRLLEDPRRSPV